ncbi:Uncharacterised protein [Shigella sonnei]|nr:Uncharacterised protein [Shigella sonnei]
MPGKQWQTNAGVNLQTLLPRNQTVIGIGQFAVCGKAHHIPGAGNRFQPWMPFQRKASTEYILCQTVDGKRNKLPRIVT